MSAREEIPALVAKWNEDIARRDLEACLGYYAPDGAFMAPNAPAALGTAALREAWTPLLSLPNLSVRIDTASVDESAAGDMCYEIGAWAMGFDTPAGRHEDHGKYVVVWKKLSGAWKAMADIFNSDVPLPAG
jgi:ketosteroid isomerase-like protein